MEEQHRLAVPDEAAAIEAATASQNGLPPAGRPYEIGADTSGIAIGGITDQCQENNGRLLVLASDSAHLSECQPNWLPFGPEFWLLLNACRDAVKHPGRIPAIIQACAMSHTNTCVDGVPRRCGHNCKRLSFYQQHQD